MVGILAVGLRRRTACLGTELHYKQTRIVDQLREMCSSLAPGPQRRCSNDVRLVASVQETLKRLSPLRERLRGEGDEDNDLRSRWTEAS